MICIMYLVPTRFVNKNYIEMIMTSTVLQVSVARLLQFYIYPSWTRAVLGLRLCGEPPSPVESQFNGSLQVGSVKGKVIYCNCGTELCRGRLL